MTDHACPTGYHAGPHNSCYTGHGCRCPGCTDQQRIFAADRRRRRREQTAPAAVTSPLDLDAAACADSDPDLFHPPKGGAAEPALAVCLDVCAGTNGDRFMADCIARNRQILDAQQDAGMGAEDSGVVGGTTHRQRDRIRAGTVTLEDVWAANRRRIVTHSCPSGQHAYPTDACAELCGCGCEPCGVRRARIAELRPASSVA